jgi:hypothetical protein
MAGSSFLWFVKTRSCQFVSLLCREVLFIDLVGCRPAFLKDLSNEVPFEHSQDGGEKFDKAYQGHVWT